MKTKSALKIVLALEVAEKLHYYQKLAKTEILLVGKTSIKGNIIRVEEAVLLAQTATLMFCELDHDSYADWIETLPDEDLPHYNCWLHTHPNMGVFWSSTDDENITKQDVPIFISVVADGSTMLGRIDLKEPIPVTINDVPVEIGFDLDKAALDEYREEIEKKVLPNTEVISDRGWPFDGFDRSLDEWPFDTGEDSDDETFFKDDEVHHNQESGYRNPCVNRQIGEEDSRNENKLLKATGYNRPRKVQR